MSYKMVSSMAFHEIPFALKNNRMHPEPAAVHLTGFKPEDPKHAILTKAMLNITENTSGVSKFYIIIIFFDTGYFTSHVFAGEFDSEKLLGFISPGQSCVPDSTLQQQNQQQAQPR